MDNKTTTRWYNYIFLFFGLFGFVASLTILYFVMRAVMDVGGYCAEGGPYEIAVHCPDGVAYLAPLSIFGMFIFGGMYFFNVVPLTLNFGYLFWTALFGALGWNFLDYAVFKGSQIEVAWLICAVLFLLMSIGPLFLILLGLGTYGSDTTKSGQNLFLRIVLFGFQLAAIALGIWVGIYVFGSLG